MDVNRLVIEIIERSSTVRERLTAAFVPCPPGSPARVGALVDDWCRIAARGDAMCFDRRLALDGLDRSRIAAALGPVRLAAREDIPEWARLLGCYIDSLVLSRGPAPCSEERARAMYSDRDRQAPFGELFAPLADVVEGELTTRAGESLAHVSPAARVALRESLIHRLARIAAPLLYHEFERHRSATCSATDPAQALTEASPGRSRRIYLDYVHRMLGGGVLEMLRAYPVLARLMATTALLWRDATEEFLLRLATDRESIAERFAGGRTPGDLVAVRPGLSDSHGGGRTVHALTFASGLRLVYKPRGLGIDAAFSDLLDWLRAHGAPLQAATSATLAPRALDRGDHGWAEYLERRECRDRTAVRRYYQYAGALLSLLHTLGSTDCHYENIMAVGDVPVMIDLETVLQPEIERADPPLDRARNLGARRLYDDSVLHTGMLPIWQVGPDAITYDIGGLSACGAQATPFTAVRWMHTNTDAMCLVHERSEVGEHPNMPLLGGSAVPPADHVDDIAGGFARMYEWLGEHAGLLLAPDGPVARLARERVRFIARPSSVYDHVLRRSLRADALRDGAARSMELELLARGLLPLASTLWPLLREEQRAIEQLDIPIFTMRGDAVSVARESVSCNGVVGGGSMVGELPVARSGLDVARSRFAALGPADLARQLQIIRGSFALRYADERHAEQLGCVEAGSLRDDYVPGSCGNIELLAAAWDIADEIWRMALTDSCGHLTWITVEPISASGRSRLQATGYGLYDGLAGIAIFLAAAARCRGDSALADLAHRALLPLSERLRSHSSTFVEEFGIGGACGAASAIYALVRVAVLLSDDALLHDAVRAAEQISPASVAADRSYDVLYGAAGAILALLALHRVRPAAALLERALTCGSHLLAKRRASPAPAGAGRRSWLSWGDHMAPGFAHGVGGIAYALLRLHASTGCAEFRDAALDAIRYEDTLIDRRNGEWPGPRAPGHAMRTSDVGAGWCRGAAGVGLARLACLELCDTPDVRRGLERAVATIHPAGLALPSPPDNICCGGFGAMELLLATGIRRAEPELVTAARVRASTIVRRRRVSGSYRLLASPVGGVYDPALYRGTAGIGYSLLRLCHPEMLPSLLLWE